MPRRVVAALLLVVGLLASLLGGPAHAAGRPRQWWAPVHRTAPAPVTSRVTRHGDQLLLDGKPWRFTGVNAFGATTSYDVNWGCGSPVDLDQLFSALRPGSVVRTWAFQALAWNNKAVTPHLDFTAVDRVVQAAQRHHQLLELTLSDQTGTCDDGVWHGPSWYAGGFRERPPAAQTDGRGLGDLSYLDYVKTIVTRYRNSPAIAFWEPVNEAEGSTCTGATGSGCWDNARRSCDDQVAAPALRSFFDQIGAVIHGIDPAHLVSSGLLGGQQCGVDGGWHAYLGASPGIDVLSYHDYSQDVMPVLLQDRIGDAHQLGKPLVVGESGLSSCRGDRAALFAAKIRAAFQAGAVGYAPWWWSSSPGACGDDFGPGDPLLTVLKTA